jgi:beta-mannosidase
MVPRIPAAAPPRIASEVPADTFASSAQLCPVTDFWRIDVDMNELIALNLTGEWTFRLAGSPRGTTAAGLGLDHPMPATVPGTVHYQLQRNNKIADPWFGRNELAQQWIDEQDWEWSRTFTVSAEDCQRARQELIFNGIDTVATFFLNDREVGQSRNMFRQVVLNLRGTLCPGENRLRVVIHSPTAFAAAEAERGKHRVPFGDFRWQTGEVRRTGRAWIRKVQCHFGWDWGVYLATSGIWLPVRLECSDLPRIAAVTIDQKHIGPVGAPEEVVLQVTVRLDSPAAAKGTLRISCDGQSAEQATQLSEGEVPVSTTITLTNPRLWWPFGEGGQHLYALEVAWEDADGRVRRESRRIGLRTTELVRDRDTAPDGKPGESFYLRINGRPIYAKGANWIPPDQFVERCTPQVYRHLLTSMTEANMNIVRVWGGGWYEQDVFYDLCDELGLMVWQDFMMACALYPDTKPALEELTAEARYQVRRLHTRPCIVLWNGDNENVTAVWEWWRKDVNFERNVEVYRAVMTALRQVVETEDRTRPFWLSSPSNDSFGENSGDPNRGDVHYWTVWHGRQPFSNYLTVKPRFASEFGFQSFPEPRTIRAVVPPEELNPSSRVMEHHQRAPDGNMLITNTMAREMRIPRDFDSFCWVSQINQAMAIRTAVEHWRRLRPWCMGTIFWQLNDLWPVASWSSIDYHGRWKALQHFSKRFFAPLLPSIVTHEKQIEVWATSDLASSINLTGHLELFTWDGRLIAKQPLTAELKAGESRAVASFSLEALLDGKVEPHEVCALARLSNGPIVAENFAALVPWKWVTLPQPRISASLQQHHDQCELVVEADQVIPFFHAELQGFEGHFDGDWQVLRPGSRYVLPWVPHEFLGARSPTLEQATAALKTFSLYDTYAHEENR